MVFLSSICRTVPEALKNFSPFFDRVVVQRMLSEAKTKGGIMLPEKAQGKVLEATVVAVGPGGRTDDGQQMPMNVKVGDRVLLPEYGGNKIVVEDNEFFIFYERDILGKFS